ncbi:MAG: hypothetical protein FWD43_00220 [Coriobacteriia bacterium]|nr:hypothetical protein [Coriobacteriia bacterium]
MKATQRQEQRRSRRLRLILAGIRSYVVVAVVFFLYLLFLGVVVVAERFLLGWI